MVVDNYHQAPIFVSFMMGKNIIPVTVLICNSNMFVPQVLSEVLGHETERFLIMSDLPNTIRFLQEFNLSNADVLQYYHTTSKRMILASRRKIIEQTCKYRIDKIVFFHAEFGGIVNWFLKEKSKTTEIYYCKVYNSMPYPKARGIKALKYCLKEWIYYGVWMDIMIEKPRMLPSLPERFYKRIGAKPYFINLNYEKIKKQMAGMIVDVGENSRVVFLTGATVKLGFVTQEEYIAKTDDLINAIGANICVAKCHPSFDDVFGKELELPTIPSYIPGNLVIGYYDVFISNHSTMLVEAAVAGKMAISLLDYYNQNPDQVKSLKNFFVDRLQGRGVIYYPKTKEEIVSLVNRNM